MKIGILTYHRSHNYGALLQAFALKTFLKKIGYYDVQFVDYYPDYHWDMYANIKRVSFKSLSFERKIKYPWYLIRYFLPLFILKEKRRQNFIKFIRKHIVKNVTGITNKNYDVVIYGSDQIWRKQRQKNCPSFNEVYFGNESINAKKRIAFSASMGIIDLNADDITFLKSHLCNFNSISVRETDLLEKIKSFSDYPIIQTLDPVFLLEKEDWINMISKRIIKSKYILFYNLQGNQEAKKIAQYISECTEYQIVELIGGIFGTHFARNVRPIDGPNQFLTWIRHAEYIVTSSFHGVALSIIFEKQFYSCIPNNAKRVSSLLDLFSLSDRLINSIEEVDLTNSINYHKIKPELNREREKSILFLQNSIKSI